MCIMINRVSPEDGRMLSSSKEKLALSKWAEAYERERGHIWCEERVLNNKARARGEFTRAAKDKPRHIFETEAAAKRASNDNRKEAQAVRDELKAKDAALSKEQRATAARHKAERAKLDVDHKARAVEIKAQAQQAYGQAKARIRAEYRPLFREQYRQAEEQRKAFEARETRLTGKIQNAMDAMGYARQARGEDQGAGIGNVFRFMSSAGARREALVRMHDAFEREIAGRQDAAIREAKTDIVKSCNMLLQENRQRFVAEKGQMDLAHKADSAALRSKWKTRTEERKGVWEAFRERADKRRQREAELDQRLARFEAARKAPGASKAGQAVQTVRKRPTRPLRAFLRGVVRARPRPRTPVGVDEGGRGAGGGIPAVGVIGAGRKGPCPAPALTFAARACPLFLWTAPPVSLTPVSQAFSIKRVESRKSALVQMCTSLRMELYTCLRLQH